MTYQLTDISAVRKRLEIEIPQEVVDEEITRIAREIGRRARVPGFRPGKAPIGIVKNRYRDDILSETCQHLLPRYFSEAAQSEGLHVVDQPTYDDIDHGKDKPLKFSASFEVYPVLDVTNHVGIPIESVPTEVTDEEVEAALDRMIEEHSEMQPVEEDRGVESGDFAEITFTGVLKAEGTGDEEEPLSGEKALCEVGAPSTVDEFTANLTGARVGETRTFEVRYKDDYPDQRLAGKTARYDVEVLGIREKHRPASDDDFAQSVGEYQTIAELRADLRKNLESHKESHGRQRRRDDLLRWLEDHNEFEVPEALVDYQLQVRLQRLMQDLYRRGVNPRGLDVDWGRIRQDQYDHAVRDVRGSLILDHLAEREGLQVSEAEIDSKIEEMAANTNQPAPKVRKILEEDGGTERLRDQLRHEKVLELLETKARILETDGAKTSATDLSQDAGSP
jgi:trigger factor